MPHDKAYTFVAALLRRSKNRTATNLDHYAKRSKVEMLEHKRQNEASQMVLADKVLNGSPATTAADRSSRAGRSCS